MKIQQIQTLFTPGKKAVNVAKNLDTSKQTQEMSQFKKDIKSFANDPCHWSQDRD